MRILIVLLCLLPVISKAQGFASLVADSVEIQNGDQLIATGNVEAFYDGTRLSAAKIIFDQTTDRLQIFGPIFIQSPDGTILTAARAELDPVLENGLLRGARLVLVQQLQLAANQIDRVDGRYSQLYKTSVTSCQVCGNHPPLWSIRAERIVHDEVERQLYFENATFHVRDFPIFWIPRARLPDPTLERATGFLIPKIRTTNRLSTGLKLPYFIVLGDHRDLTFTPYVSSKTTTLEARYRQAFLRGDIEFNVAVSDDTLVPDQTRAYFFAEGAFELPRDFDLSFDIENVSDPAYLIDYGYSGKDRLDSAIGVRRVRDTDLFDANITYYESLRDDEINGTLPPIVAELGYQDRSTTVYGGVLDWSLGADAFVRTENGTAEEARDVARIGADVGWNRNWLTQSGVVATTHLGLQSDYYFIGDDTTYRDDISRTLPQASLRLSYPLTRNSENAKHLLEPTLAIHWSDTIGDIPPNEDSTRSELDHGNLFWPSHFTGDDAVETGLRAAAGLTWSRKSGSGLNTRLTFGRVYQDELATDYTASSGLDSALSDWLIAGQIDLAQSLRFEARALIAKNLRPTLAAAAFEWHTGPFNLYADYLFQNEDLELGTGVTSEWFFDTAYQIDDTWKVSFDTRYDVVANTPVDAGLGVEWRNECVTVDLSVSRRFTSSTTVDPSTDYGLSVTLNGFSAGRSVAGPAVGCNK